MPSHRGADMLKRSSHPMRENQLLCRDCHDPHGGAGDALAIHATTNDTCFACHAEKRGPFLWEHPPAAEDCISATRRRGATNRRCSCAAPRSFVRDATLPPATAASPRWPRSFRPDPPPSFSSHRRA